MPKFFSYYPHAQNAYSKIDSLLNGIKAKRVVDIGCSDFFNFSMFNTDFYIGVDLDLEDLKKGLARFSDDRCIGCIADISNLPDFSELADLVVCTFTLIFFSPMKRVEIVSKLCNLTKTRGDVVLETPNSDNISDIISLVENNFKSYKVYYYGGRISWSLHYRLKRKHLNFFDKIVFGKSISVLLSFFIEKFSIFDFSKKKRAIIIGYDKIQSDSQKAKNDYKLFEKLSKGLYKVRTLDLKKSNALNNRKEILKNKYQENK